MADSWSAQLNRLPTNIGQIAITLYDTDGQAVNHKAKYTVKVLDQNNELLKEISGNLKPHLTPTQITAVVNFLEEIRTKAVNEIIPS